MTDAREVCDVCKRADCYGPVQHQMAIMATVYRLAHNRGDHNEQPSSLCPACDLEATNGK